MKLISVIIAILIFFNSASLPVLASPNKLPVPDITGESAILIDVTTGQTLYSKNPDEKLHPASTTKMMTGLIAIEKGNVDEIVTASNNMLNQDIVYGTRIYLEPGEQLSVRNLLYALLLNSANDAAVAIAEHISGSVEEFAVLMNERAKEVGAVNTTFKNPSGLTEEGHLTTSRDLALIARVAYQNPLFREYVGTKTQVIPRVKEGIPTEMSNENRLIWRDSAITGIKTGYTAAAKNTFVASASKDGRELIGVILKSPGREIYGDMEKLLDYGFSNFENKVYKPEGAALASININETSVNLVLDKPIIYTQEIGNDNNPEISLNVLPVSSEFTEIEKGQVVTKVQVMAEGRVLNVFPLISASSVKPVAAAIFSKTKIITLWIILQIIVLLLFYYRYKKASYRRRRSQRQMVRRYLTRDY